MGLVALTGPPCRTAGKPARAQSDHVALAQLRVRPLAQPTIAYRPDRPQAASAAGTAGGNHEDPGCCRPYGHASSPPLGLLLRGRLLRMAWPGSEVAAKHGGESRRACRSTNCSE